MRAWRRDVARRWLLAAPALLLVFFAAVGPLLVMVVYSFLAKGSYGGVVFWDFSLEAWRGVLFRRDLLDGGVTLATSHISILWRSIWLAVVTTILTLLLGFPTAYFIATRHPARRTFWVFLITIPFWSNLLIRTFSMQEVLRNEGVINLALLRIGVIQEPLQIMFTEWAILFGMVYVYLPLMVLPLYSSMERIDFRLIEAGYDLYATRAQVLRRIIIPSVRPGIVAGSILVFIPAIGAYVIPRVLGGGRNLMLANLIELQFGQARNWPLGASLSLTMMAATSLALIFYLRRTGERGRDG